MTTSRKGNCMAGVCGGVGELSSAAAVRRIRHHLWYFVCSFVRPLRVEYFQWLPAVQPAIVVAVTVTNKGNCLDRNRTCRGIKDSSVVLGPLSCLVYGSLGINCFGLRRHKWNRLYSRENIGTGESFRFELGA